MLLVGLAVLLGELRRLGARALGAVLRQALRLAVLVPGRALGLRARALGLADLGLGDLLGLLLLDRRALRPGRPGLRRAVRTGMHDGRRGGRAGIEVQRLAAGDEDLPGLDDVAADRARHRVRLGVTRGDRLVGVVEADLRRPRAAAGGVVDHAQHVGARLGLVTGELGRLRDAGLVARRSDLLQVAVRELAVDLEVVVLGSTPRQVDLEHTRLFAGR